MATPTAWQLGEDLKGKLFPVLRDVRELRGKIDLEITHKRDEIEFGSVNMRMVKNPTPEDPEKIRRLGENLITTIKDTIDKYETLCRMEINKLAVQETGHVTTTCPEVGECQEESINYPTDETEPPSPFINPEIMEYQETILPDEKPARPNRRLERRAAIEDEETIDLGKL